MDLADFVSPIVRGECDCTCGQWRLSSDLTQVESPSFNVIYQNTPCCHQSFFLSKEWYMKLGGYNDADFRCIADGDLMWRMWAAGARVEVVPKPVILYLEGGFSSTGDKRFLNESLIISQRYRDEITALARDNADYRAWVMIRLAMYVYQYPLYVQAGGKDPRRILGQIREFYASILSTVTSRFHRFILKIICGAALPAFAAGKNSRLRRLLLWRLPALFLPWPKDVAFTRACVPLPLAARLFRRSIRRG